MLSNYLYVSHKRSVKYHQSEHSICIVLQWVSVAQIILSSWDWNAAEIIIQQCRRTIQTILKHTQTQPVVLQDSLVKTGNHSTNMVQ